MRVIIGWAIGLIVALFITFVFEVKEPITGVLIGFFFSMLGMLLGDLTELN